jgi:hypothetical protein
MLFAAMDVQVRGLFLSDDYCECPAGSRFTGQLVKETNLIYNYLAR